ncbi:thiol:disulfide interchange protein DsbC [Paucimonas lemoignei]|uniref:Thiol:disulfide interchange protein n=1 Tax=Paucimonas lemoignei TaxID=29443 RepID=A0A4R3HVE7_PAULE|nr:DsbC family protein [Paucimonas lemoignei]TCS37217.1 thiol:disulfide interchange protein DsbC [Paucimonas lemoignei]
MKSIKLAAVALFSIACTSAVGQSAEEAAVKKLIEPRLGERAKVVSVTRTPYSGLFEVRTNNNDILYTDKKAQYLFVGNIIDTTTYQNYTKARTDEISKIKFSDLPFDSALKMVKGNGKRVMAIFEDPNCGYCKRFRHTLQEMDNVTVYTFMYNILSEDSGVKSKNIWCSPDRAKAWDEWMLNGKAQAPAPESCLTNPNEKIFELGQKLKITGTPTIFFADGSRIPGAVDLKTVEAKLATIK